METLKKSTSGLSWLAFIVATCFYLQPMTAAGAAVDGACSQGNGIPPFLSSGADPNLLLLLDNSGSMLDIASRDENAACTDNTFVHPDPTDPAKPNYAGLFEPTSWYYWTKDSSSTSYYFAPISAVVDATTGNITFPSDINFDSTSGAIEYSQPDLVVKIAKTTDTDGITIEVVTAFAATGNLLNWASASKFDIEKKILTGGKYDEINKVLVSEGRGCSARPYIKEVPVTYPDPNNPTATLNKVITFSVRGYAEESYDSPDHLTRIAIMGVTSGGFSDTTNNPNYQRCLDAIAEWNKDTSGLTEEEEKTRQGVFKQAASDCLDYGATKNGFEDNSNSAYNGSVHECWFAKEKKWTYEQYMAAPEVSTVATENACDAIYEDGFEPNTINVQASGYVCSGDYDIYDYVLPKDGGYDPDTSDPRTYGYVGRCWIPGTPPPGCEKKTCDSSEYQVDPDKKGESVCFKGLLYTCSDYWWSEDGTCRTRKDGYGNAVALKKVWIATPATDDPVCDLTINPGTDGAWVGGRNSTEQGICVKNALWDFCNGLTIPEEIDPSDPLGPGQDSGDAWGLIGSLIDASVQNYFDNTPPIIEMQVRVAQAEAPKGIIHEVAGDLRIGVMAFNDNGALTECTIEDTLPDTTIVKYCPKNPDGTQNNRDGAKVIVPIADTDTAHVDLLTGKINAVSATTWTPLAEALYNAIGYYGQNSTRRLNNLPDADFLTAGETGPPDPVQYWCQDNNILLITEGASTADINQQVIDFVKSAPPDNATTEKQCPDLYGSTYLDDMTYYAQNADVSELYTTPATDPGYLVDSDGTPHPKRNIRTYVVTTGKLRNDATNTDECNPATIMTNAANNGGSLLLTGGEDPDLLEENLRAALGDIMNRASAGSAASVISSSRTGEGAAYQAIFWPKMPRGSDEDALSWVGDVHSLFIDSASQMWDDHSGNGDTGTADPKNNTGRLWSEDSNGDGHFDTSEDSNSNGCLDGDRRVFFYYDQTDQLTKICFNDSVRTSDPPICNTNLTGYCDSAGEPFAIQDFHDYLWSANQHLDDVVVIDENRSVDTTSGRWDWTSTTGKKRYIFTWNDLNNDGLVDQREVLGLENKTATSGTDWSSLNNTSDSTIQHNILDDFNIDATLLDSERVEKMKELVNWLRGADEVYESTTGTDSNGDPTFTDTNGNGKQDYVYRCRRYKTCLPPDTPNIDQPPNNPPGTNPNYNPVWRLGDVIHSTPTLVAQPAEAYHTLYSDTSYAWFVKKYRYRRQVVYFGANDGMMHAFNAGFFHEDTKSFCKALNADNECDDTKPGPDIGDELWAYIPYNLQPHLKCLSDPEYNHKYFVDQQPRIMDVQIFEEDDAHPYGWGTILIGAMGFGGAPVDANDATPIIGTPAVNRRFISSYFVLDITDPERPPELLGEMTMTTTSTLNADGSKTVEPNFADLGYTIPLSTGVVMRADDGTTNWYLVFGNGPTTLKGENTQQGKVAVLPLNWLSQDTTTRKPFRIPNEAPTASTNEGGIFLVPAAADGGLTSFTGDLVNVDYNINSRMTTALGALYRSDAIYFGTVDGSGFVPYSVDDPLYNSMYPEEKHWNGGGRLYRMVTHESQNSDQPLTEPHDWKLKPLLDAKAPITAAPQISWDGYSNWIYFGTGRFFDKDDKTDKDQNYFFGIKEPMKNLDNCSNTAARYFTWDPIVYDVSDIPWTSPSFTPGSRGLFRADQVLVVEKSDVGMIDENPYVFCKTSGCQLSTLGLTDLDGAGNYAFQDMLDYIEGSCDATTNQTKGIDGWFRQFEDPRERNIGQSTLLGGLVTFTTYQPSSDICMAEGQSFLYGVHYQTGTAWYENVFGTYTHSNGKQIVKDKLSLGLGLATTPSIHVGKDGTNDATALIELSTGEIIEIGQENLPISPLPPGKIGWTDQCE